MKCGVLASQNKLGLLAMKQKLKRKKNSSSSSANRMWVQFRGSLAVFHCPSKSIYGT